MVNVYIPESVIWTDKVRMIEKKDPVLGGTDGPANWAAQDLTNRTAWLKNQITLLGTNKVNVSDWDLAMIALAAKNKDQDTAFEQFKLFVNNTFDDMPVSSGYSATRKYNTGDLVKVDGIWYEAYHPDGCKGRDPRDKANRPSGWTNTDVHAPYYWIEIGKYLMLPEIGSPIHLMTINHREGVIKLRNDGQLSADKFWRIAELNKNIVNNRSMTLPDLRSNVIRSLDDGRSVDAGRVINSYQDDAMPKIYGRISDMWVGRNTSTNEAFQQYENLAGLEMQKGSGALGWANSYDFDSSRSFNKTAHEIRMKNIALLCTIRI